MIIVLQYQNRTEKLNYIEIHRRQTEIDKNILCFPSGKQVISKTINSISSKKIIK